MSVDQNVKEIEIHIDEVKAQIKRRDALVSLAKNRNWKKIIDEGFFKDEAIRLVMLKGSNLTDEQQERVDKMIFSISSFYSYLQNIMQIGNQAEADLAADEQTYEELHEEALN